MNRYHKILVRMFLNVFNDNRLYSYAPLLIRTKKIKKLKELLNITPKEKIMRWSDNRIAIVTIQEFRICTLQGNYYVETEKV